jgi:ATP-dependent Clp protease, protease subunit
MNRIPIYNLSVHNNANGNCDVYIDGAIVDASTQKIYAEYFGDDSLSSFKSIRDQITKSGSQTINFYINSVGGMVTEAMAIHDYIVNLQSKGYKVNTYGRGIIASSATYILMASENSTISENSWFMIHNCSGFAYGDVNEVENQAATLRKFNDKVTNFYCKATNLSTTVIGNMMNKETWFTGDEAVEKGFVKNVEGQQNFTNSISTDNWLFSNKEVLQAYNSFTPQNSNFMDIKTISNSVKDSIINHLKELGVIKNDADSTKLEGIATAVENALKPLNEEVDTKIKNAIDAAMDKLPELIKNAITESVKDVATKDDIANEVKKVSDELEVVKGDIANKTGNPITNQTTSAPDKFDMDGITWED